MPNEININVNFNFNVMQSREARGIVKSPIHVSKRARAHSQAKKTSEGKSKETKEGPNQFSEQIVGLTYRPKIHSQFKLENQHL